MQKHKYSDFYILKRLILIARSYWGLVALIFFIGLLATPLALLVPVPLKVAVDSVINSSPLPHWLDIFVPDSIAESKTSLLVLAAIMQVLVVLFVHLQFLVLYVLQTYTGERLTLKLRQSLFRHVHRLSFAFHDARGTADSIYRIQYDAPSIQWVVIYGIIPFISSSLTIISMFYVIVRINVQLAIISLFVVPFLVILSRRYSTRMRPKYTQVKKMESSVLGIVQEVMGAFRVVKAFNREESEQLRFENQSKATVKQRIKLAFSESVYGLLINVTVAAGTAGVLYVGVRNVLTDDITLGELLMVIAYLSQMYGPLKTISTKVSSLQTNLASAQRAFELLDEIPDVKEKPHATAIKRANGNIEFKNLQFSYDGENNVLENISFTIKAGSCVGIAGRTGAGKTTLVSLLPRFYDPTKGAILLDNRDIRDYKLNDLRNQFSIVLQEPVLFSTTIRENIAYAKRQATEKEIENCAKAANAHEFIINLPDGYDTIVGERGMRLSGGERQRISLARAFLKDAPILILDEPTSSVDIQTEKLIMDAMERLKKGKTTFMIAHRLSTLENCDQTIEIDNGRIVS
ncbi:MAG: ABC transporter ATP-binding protein [Sedimentisphaerales bacterium]|nr:ABC transporter ATP-binding protein [Sedimentisphaerales bacterium]